MYSNSIIALFVILKCCLVQGAEATNQSCGLFSSFDVNCGSPKDICSLLSLEDCSDENCSVGRSHECMCATHDRNSTTTAVGFCYYGCSQPIDIDTALVPETSANASALSSKLCGPYRRKGFLCGSCQEETYPAVYTFNMACIQCRNSVVYNWIRFVVWALVPLTIFYVVVMLLTINVMSSKLSGYIIFSQIVSPPVVMRKLLLKQNVTATFITSIKVFGAIYGIWNMDFLKTFNDGICLQTSTLVNTLLDILIAVYPLLLVLVTHKLVMLYDRSKLISAKCKPVLKIFSGYRSKRKKQTSLIDAIATFVYLINIKILNSCFDLLIPVEVYTLKSEGTVNCSTRLFYDADIVYFGPQHRAYGITAIVVLTLFVFLPTLLLLLYPLKIIQKLLNLLLLSRWQLALRTFVESFNGCYKNGTNDEKDFRCFAALPFAFRIVAFLFFLVTTDWVIVIYVSILLIVYVIIILVAEPFKEEYKHLMESHIFYKLLLSSICVCCTLYTHYYRFLFDELYFFTFSCIIIACPAFTVIIRILYGLTKSVHKFCLNK